MLDFPFWVTLQELISKWTQEVAAGRYKKSGAILAYFMWIYIIILIYEVIKQTMKTWYQWYTNFITVQNE